MIENAGKHCVAIDALINHQQYGIFVNSGDIKQPMATIVRTDREVAGMILLN